jgi:phosphoserine aminotransferase
MAQPYDRIFNFSAGPSTLPVPVLEQVQSELLNYSGTGMSVMEMSHRSAAFEGILAKAKADFKELFQVPEGYHVLFLQGGASTQFATVPMAFLAPGKVAQYVLTGSWGKKAIESAKPYGASRVIFDGKAGNYSSIPANFTPEPTDDASYTHFTTNETIQGVQFAEDPIWEGDLVADMSSDIASRPLDVSRYAMFYAGAQKNVGPAGVTLVVIKDEFLAKTATNLPPMFDYKVQAENDSLYNTPPTFGIYVCGLVFQYLLDNGGLTGAQARNEKKAAIIYEAIDNSQGFYRGHATPESRSKMNVTFTLPSEELTKAFLKEADSQRLDGLKGHRSVGGIRASIYNAFPDEGCLALTELMSEFAKRHG